MPILQMRKQRLQDVKCLTQGHIVREWMRDSLEGLHDQVELELGLEAEEKEDNIPGTPGWFSWKSL